MPFSRQVQINLWKAQVEVLEEISEMYEQSGFHDKAVEADERADDLRQKAIFLVAQGGMDATKE